jgi:hypothetical protein
MNKRRRWKAKARRAVRAMTARLCAQHGISLRAVERATARPGYGVAAEPVSRVRHRA